MKKIKAIFFDLDGTLIDSKKDIVSSVNDLRAELSLELMDSDEIISYVGKGSNYLLTQVLPEFDEHERFYDRFIELYKINSLKYAFFYEGALELLEKLTDYKKVLITNKAYVVTMEIIKKYNLENTFELIYGGDTFHERKPSPYPLNKALENLNLASHEVVYFGDSHPDYQASKAAKMKCILATYGYGDMEELEKFEDVFFVNKPLELEDILQSLESF